MYAMCVILKLLSIHDMYAFTADCRVIIFAYCWDCAVHGY